MNVNSNAIKMLQGLAGLAQNLAGVSEQGGADGLQFGADSDNAGEMSFSEFMSCLKNQKSSQENVRGNQGESTVVQELDDMSLTCENASVTGITGDCANTIVLPFLPEMTVSGDTWNSDENTIEISNLQNLLAELGGVENLENQFATVEEFEQGLEQLFINMGFLCDEVSDIGTEESNTTQKNVVDGCEIGFRKSGESEDEVSAVKIAAEALYSLKSGESESTQILSAELLTKDGVSLEVPNALGNLEGNNQENIESYTEKQTVEANLATGVTQSTTGFETNSEVMAKAVQGVVNNPKTVNSAYSENAGVYKTAVAQVGEAIVSELEALNVNASASVNAQNTQNTKNVSETATSVQGALAYSEEDVVITASQVEQALLSNPKNGLGDNLNNLANSSQNQTTQTAQTSVIKEQMLQVSEIKEFKVMLKPEHLGDVLVKLLVDGSKITVVITAATLQARDLLITRSESVRAMVGITGMTVERYEVVVATTEIADELDSKSDYLENGEGSSGKQSSEQGDEGTDQGNEADALDKAASFAEIVEEMRLMAG
ncbi:MAG: flagellar hook-length control protein FliK [Oscillospiraceae bacterium]|nr:flagellar hook-length control protein FliK [Oscillospiraceae bacterium]